MSRRIRGSGFEGRRVCVVHLASPGCPRRTCRPPIPTRRMIANAERERCGSAERGDLGDHPANATARPDRSRDLEASPGDDGEKARKEKWAVRHIPEWKGYCRKMMGLPYTKETKGSNLRESIEADAFAEFGAEPKERWVRTLAESVYDSVLADMKREAIMGKGNK